MEMTFEEFKEKIKTKPKDRVVLLPTQLLSPAEYNPRVTNDSRYQALKESMKADKAFMQLRPVLVNTFEGREGIVFAGARRLLAAQELEWEQIPALLVNVDLKTEKAWNLKDNTHAGDWDEVSKKELLVELHDAGYDMASVGFGADEIVDMIGGSTTAMVEGKQDSEYGGTTPGGGGRKPKVKIAEGAELTCPECGTKFTYGLKVETTGENEAVS